MPLRLIEICIPESKKKQLTDIFNDKSVIVSEKSFNNQAEIKLFLSAEITESFLDEFNKAFSPEDKFSVLILSVEACLPPYVDKEPEKIIKFTEESNLKKNEKAIPVRISREELFNEITTGSKLTKIYISLVVLSAIVGAIGLINSNIAVIIGSMVIAPFLGPNIAITFALATADMKLYKRAILTTVTGFAIVIAVTVAIGYFFEFDTSATELQKRTVVNTTDVILAFASGVAGALAFDTRISTALVGVMVAVALLPPLVAAGLFFGAGYMRESVMSSILFLVNLTCINLSGLITFKFQKIRPRKHEDSRKSMLYSVVVSIFWIVFLAGLLYLLRKL